jgi:hypothetical protein
MPVSDLLLARRRAIAGYIPQVVVAERHRDALRITRHPVEKGAAITDHAYKEPAAVEMHVLWRAGIAPVSGRLFGVAIHNVADLYAALLKVQASRGVFDVTTGKRSYSNMLIEELEVTTDADSEHALECRFRLQQIIVVDTAITQLSSADPQAIPAAGNQLRRAGNKQLAPTDKTIPYRGYYGVVHVTRLGS